MVKDVFAELNIPVVIKWNNRKLMSGLLEVAGVTENLVADAIGLIDRMNKISKAELVLEFGKIGIDEQQVNNILDLFSKTLEEYKQVFEATENSNIKQGLEELTELQELINKLDMQDTCEFSPTLARGLSIYTGTVFEFFDKQKRISSSLGGGGRYDKIITEFMNNGQEYPAVGLCFGLEPIFALLEKTKQKNLVDVFVIPMGTEVECLKLASSLRASGLNVLLETNKRKVKKSFDYANKVDIKYVIVVGSNELENGRFALKNMQTGEQTDVTLEEMLKILKG